MFDLEPLPPDDGAPFRCAQQDELPAFPFYTNCLELAVGMVPRKTARYLRLSEWDRAVCAKHHKILDDDLID